LPIDIAANSTSAQAGIAGLYRKKDMAGDAYRNRPAIG
jgi:hypothetical protein